MNDKGTEMLCRMLGEGRSKEVRETWTKLSPDFASLVTNFLAGEIWSRPNLDLRTRSLVTVAALTALGRPNGLRLNIEMALNNGATKEEIVETLLQMAPYAGFPACWEGLLVADDVFKLPRTARTVESVDAITEPTRFVGVDVQAVRGCPYVVLDQQGEAVDCDWLQGKELGQVVDQHSATGRSQVIVGIDAPRKPLSSPRQWYWDGPRRDWRPSRASDRGNGRHCEVVIAAHRLANPQWTPYRPQEFQSWMKLGFALFAELARHGRAQVYEVFPTAAYSLLANDTSVRIGLRLKGFNQGPKDMLDAYVAAATVREFIQGRGAWVGGGDGLGKIVLPRPLPNPIPRVLEWPGS